MLLYLAQAGEVRLLLKKKEPSNNREPIDEEQQQQPTRPSTSQSADGSVSVSSNSGSCQSLNVSIREENVNEVRSVLRISELNFKVCNSV